MAFKINERYLNILKDCLTIVRIITSSVVFKLLVGLDIPKHGEPAYPAEAYGHGWGEKGDTLFTMVRKATQGYSSTIKLGR